MDPLDNNAMESGDLTSVARAALIKTRPWMLFVTILGFIYVAALIGIMVFSLLQGEISALFNVISIGITGFLYWLLFQSAQRIKQFGADNSPVTLEDALLHYKNYWLVSGILLIFALAIMALAIVGGLLVAASM